MSTHVYPITAFANEAVALSKLDAQVRQSPITIALASVDQQDAPTGDVGIAFKADLSAIEVGMLDAIVSVHDGVPLPDPTTIDGKPIVALDSPQANGAARVAVAPLEGPTVNYVSPNLCDPCVWADGSIRMTNIALVDSGDGLTWTSGTPHWIDMVTGRVSDDDGVRAEEAGRTPGHHGWSVAVTVDGVAKTAREYGEPDGGEYTIDYELGAITFFASQATKDVRATFSAA